MKQIVGLLLATLAASGAFANEWRMQGDGELLFEATWEGEAIPGRFHGFDVCLESDDGQIVGAALTVTVQIDSADMDDPDMNEAIVGDEWFAAAAHPVATFRSDTIRAGDDGGYVAQGQLELKGMRLPLAVPLSWTETNGRGEMRGEVVVDRTRYDVGSGEWASGETIGSDVRVSFSVILERQ